MDFGTKIKELRNESELSQVQCANKLGIAQNTLSQFENGRARPSYEILTKMARLFDVTTDYLLGLTDEWGNTTEIQKSPADLSADKKELLTVYDSLSPTRKQDVLTLVKSFASADASKK